jgi:predicted GIY-YIG superfamily endonuclease
MHGPQKKIVYIIRNDRDRSRHYTGITNDLPRRLERHNYGRYGRVASDPWSLVVSLEFPTEVEARRFEK